MTGEIAEWQAIGDAADRALKGRRCRQPERTGVREELLKLEGRRGAQGPSRESPAALRL
jgi:hypothetical protein